MVLRNVAKTFSLEEQRQEINEIAVDLDAVNTTLTNWNAANWDTAYSWGDHAQAGYWVDNSTSRTNWDTAYGWGDHSQAGYLTSESDPVFGASPAGGITNTNITNWNTAYGWGDHSTAGYLTAEADTLDTITARGSTTNNGITVGGITVNGNMTVNGTQTVINTTTLKVSDNEITLNNDVTGTPTENAGIEVERGLSANVRIRWDETSDRWQFTNNGSNYTNIAVNISDLPNDSGFISSYTETDPIFSASAASSITTQNLTDWNAAYNWGDHSTAGYATTTQLNTAVANSANWDTAYGWGDHSTAGYLTSLGTAIVDGDFPASNGFMKRTGAGTYTIDTNTYVTTSSLTTEGTWTLSLIHI